MSNPTELFLGDKPVNVGAYPDGVPVIDWDEVAHQDNRCLTIRTTDVTPFMAGLWLADAFTERNSAVDTLVVPCLPGARQDRLGYQGDFLFTAKSLASEINSRNFDRVICFDPHSDVMPSLIDRCEIVHISEIIHLFPWSVVPTVDFIIAPDAGAAKRAADVAAALGVPLVQAWKTRDGKTNKLSGFGIQDLSEIIAEIEDPKGLIVDDICDGGGTFIGLGQLIKACYPTVELQLYVSHGFFSKGLNDLMGVFTHLYTTNSTMVSALAAPVRFAPSDSGFIEIANILPTLLTKAL